MAALIGLVVWIVAATPSGILRSVHAQENSRAIGAVRVESNQPGVLEVSWDAPTATPREYRVMWARVDESFPSYRDNYGNAYPTEPTYTITGLDEGVRYKVKVRARYDDYPGDWSAHAEAVVAAAAPTATLTPTATDTSIPTATATPTSTATPIPTATAATNSRAIGAVSLASNQPGVLEVSWDAPTATPRDYRIIWTRVDEAFPSWRDNYGNAYPTEPTYTITGLDQGVRYKVKVRGRYDGSPGDWSAQAEAIVAAATPTATATLLALPAILQATATVTATPTATATPTEREVLVAPLRCHGR